MVYKRIKDGEWEEAVRTKKTKALVKGLKSHTMLVVDGLDCVDYNAEIDYELQVMAVNSAVTSLETKRSAEAALSTAAITAIGASIRVACSFFALCDI